MLRCLLFAVMVLLGAGAALAGECPPDYPKDLPCPQDPWETAQLEHEDRRARLLRLAEGALGFEFEDLFIPPERLKLDDFPEGLPVLRVAAGQDVFFDSGSDIIRPEAYPLLDIIAQSLKLEPPDVSLFVAGHTDWDGDEAYNMDLGMRRAHRVATALVTRGIYQASIYRISFGEHTPIATNETARGKSRNRRVEFLFSARAKAIVDFLIEQPIAPCAAEFQDAAGTCKRTEILIPPPVKVSIAPEHQQQVIDLSEKAAEIERDRSLSEIELQEARQAIEAERERIPIDVSEERVPIYLSGQ